MTADLSSMNALMKPKQHRGISDLTSKVMAMAGRSKKKKASVKVKLKVSAKQH